MFFTSRWFILVVILFSKFIVEVYLSSKFILVATYLVFHLAFPLLKLVVDNLPRAFSNL